MDTWWQTILTGSAPALLAIIVTHFVNKRQYDAKLDEMRAAAKSAESGNAKLKQEVNKVTLETYGDVADRFRKEIDDMDARFDRYMVKSNERERVLTEKIEQLEKENAKKDEIIKLLESKIDDLSTTIDTLKENKS